MASDTSVHIWRHSACGKRGGGDAGDHAFLGEARRHGGELHFSPTAQTPPWTKSATGRGGVRGGVGGDLVRQGNAGGR